MEKDNRPIIKHIWTVEAFSKLEAIEKAKAWNLKAYTRSYNSKSLFLKDIDLKSGRYLGRNYDRVNGLKTYQFKPIQKGDF